MPKYRSMAQSPRPQADGVGGPPRRNFADEPPTPDEPKHVWGDSGSAQVHQAAASRRASFQKFLKDNPHVAQKRMEQRAPGRRCVSDNDSPCA